MLQLDVCEGRVAKCRDVHNLVTFVSFVPRDNARVTSYASSLQTKGVKKWQHTLSQMVNWYTVMIAGRGS